MSAIQQQGKFRGLAEQPGEKLSNRADELISFCDIRTVTGPRTRGSSNVHRVKVSQGFQSQTLIQDNQAICTVECELSSQGKCQ